MAEDRKEQSPHEVEHEDKEEAAREGHGHILATLKAEDKKKEEEEEKLVTGRTTDEKGVHREDQAVDRHFHSQEKREEAKKKYLYHEAGLFERHGYVPWWLQGVVVVLLIWSVYYTVTNWSPTP